MDRTPENIVTSYMYYMWNMWSKEECAVVFGGDMSIWGKWTASCERCNSAWGATERFYAELDTLNRQKLVNRAIEKYNGRSEI